MNDQTNSNDLDIFLGVEPVKPWKKWAKYGAIALVLIAILFLLSRCFAGEEAPKYATEKLAKGALTVTVSATGNLQPTNQIDVGSEQSGLITDVYVQNNDHVVKGQLLARLDPQKLNDAVVQAEAAAASSVAGIAQAKASYVQAQANLNRLEEVYRLSGGKVPSKTEMDTGRANQQSTLAALRAAEAQNAQNRARLSSARFDLSRASIYSPITGVVLSRKVEPGQTVAASFNAPVLFIIAEDLSKMQLEVKVDEADIAQVRSGQRAEFTVDAYPGRNFPASIQRVDVGANDSNSSTSTSTSSTTGSVVAYTAVLTLDNPDLTLRPGMTATAEIITMEEKNVLLVPNAALRFSPDQAKKDANGGVTGVLVPRRIGRNNNQQRQSNIGRGSQQTIYIVGSDGKPSPVSVIVGNTNGSVTTVSGPNVRAGMQVITGQLSTDSNKSSKAKSGGKGVQARAN